MRCAGGGLDFDFDFAEVHRWRCVVIYIVILSVHRWRCVSHRRWDTIDAAWTWRELPERSATCVADTILSAPRRQTRVCKRALMHCGNSPLMWRVSSSVQERSFNYIKGNAIFVRDLIELLLDDPFLYTCCELLYSYEFFKCTYPFYCNEWGHL